MVNTKNNIYIQNDGCIDVSAWLQSITHRSHSERVNLIAQACQLSQLTGGDTPIYENKTCLQMGIEMAELLFDLHADQHTIAAAILYNNVEYTDLDLEDIEEQLGKSIAKLILGSMHMETMHYLLKDQTVHTSKQRNQVDNLRKMLLAMVGDVRVVLIKLAERTCLTRLAAKLPTETQQQIALETFHIYAPLANRLGIGQLKWELEDLCFRYMHPHTYKDLAKKLDSKRAVREKYIENIITVLNEALNNAGIKGFETSGRAKHIYSIYRKMQRKNIDYHEIYDVSAVRVLVQSIEDCYAVLSCVHTLWPQVQEEFDDYITSPKSNGYRSIHTAVVGPQNNNVEVQIRTFDMHQESELGVAAHWKYKEGSSKQDEYEEKIAWLRQVMEWQRELVISGKSLDHAKTKNIFDDRIYVFTPDSEIIDLATGSTPLDFAYHIHSEIGHRCRGAKINGSIVPLTYRLKTGDRIEILKQKHAKPSRDWLNPKAGYVFSNRAKSKIHHWFKKQDYDNNAAQGEKELEHDLRRLGNTFNHKQIDFNKVAQKFNFKSVSDLYAAIGNGDIKIGQIVNGIKEMFAIDNVKPEIDLSKINKQISKQKQGNLDIQIEGVDNLLCFFAGCCKPIPGDDIVGFITRGRGVSIHRSRCKNILNTPHPERLLKVSWSQAVAKNYPVDISIAASERQYLVRDILNILAAEKIELLSIRTQTNQRDNITQLDISIKISKISELDRLISRLKATPDINHVTRRTSCGREMLQ